MLEEFQEVLVETYHFNVYQVRGRFNVLSIPHEFIPNCAWWLIQQLPASKCCPGSKATKSTFSSFIMDDDGLSLIADVTTIPTLKKLLKSENLYIHPQQWSALIVNLTSSAFEFPGSVNYISHSLSAQGLPIMHISTFETEVFLVHEEDFAKAIEVFKEIADPQTFTDYLTKRPSVVSEVETEQIRDEQRQQSEESDEYDGRRGNFDINWLSSRDTPSFDLNALKEEATLSSGSYLDGGFALRVLPKQLYLCKLSDIEDLSLYCYILINLMLYDKRSSALERSFMDGVIDEQPANESCKEEKATFMWGIWQLHEEITFLLDEDDVAKFPEGALIISPQKWRVIKLTGRPIAFDETGVVSSMSRIHSNVPSLNISTSVTNCTLVPDELLDTSLQTLSSTMRCPVYDIEGDSQRESEDTGYHSQSRTVSKDMR